MEAKLWKVAQNSIHYVLIFRLLLKITVSCVFHVLYNHLFGALRCTYPNLNEMFELKVS